MGILGCLLGAEALVRGAVDLATRLRLPPLLVGLTVVAWGTSAPELAVSVRAGSAGESDVALGNIIGSNIFNIAVVLGLGALLHPLRVTAHVVRFDAPALIGASLLAILLLADGHLSRVDGLVLLGGLVGYTGMTVWMQGRASLADRQAFAGVTPPPRGSVAVPSVLVAGGLVLLVIGADAMVHGATALARRVGVGGSAIGLTLVAAGTSLPELVTTVVAARRGQADIAIGNAVGSNLFNLLGVLGVATLVAPLSLGGVAVTDLWVMAGMAVVAVPLLWSRLTLHRWEGVLLLTVYGIYLAWRWPPGNAPMIG